MWIWATWESGVLQGGPCLIWPHYQPVIPQSLCHSWLQPGPMCLQLPGSQPGSGRQDDCVLRGCWKVGQGEAGRKGVNMSRAGVGLTAHTLCPRCRIPVNTLGLAPCHQDEYMCGPLRPASNAGPTAGYGTPMFWEAAGACDFPGSQLGACQSLLIQSPSKHSTEDHTAHQLEGSLETLLVQNFSLGQWGDWGSEWGRDWLPLS